MPSDLTDWLQDHTDEFSVTFATQEAPLSNWSAHQIRIWGKQFPTAEHAYQYMKFADLDSKFAHEIRKSTSPWLAKRLAWSRHIDSTVWDKKRESVMMEILAEKYTQHEDVRLALQQTTGLAILEKGNDPDTFWGVGRNNTGENTLGKLWMMLRDGSKPDKV